MKGLDYLYIGLLMVASYMFANLNFARIIAKINHRDITKEGSGNPGTLNVLRSFGFFWAMLNMTLEILKGVVPALTGYLICKNVLGVSGDIGLYLCGFSAVVGHIFPVVFKFKGGKGVACTCGMFFVANWWVTLIVVAVCFAFVCITSKGLIGTLSFVLTMSIVEVCLLNPVDWICYVVIGLNVALVLYAHRSNLKRFFAGKENPTNVRGAFKNDMNRIKEKRNAKHNLTQVENEGENR